MSNSEHDRRIDYIEFSVKSVPDAKRFYGAAFGWTFEDYGPDYASFADGRLTGGFRADGDPGKAPLIVIFAKDLDALMKQVEAAGGRTFNLHDFPGGRRFHFEDPGGNELAVWSDR